MQRAAWLNIAAGWEFPKIRGTLFWGPSNKDPTIYGAILGSPIFGNSQMASKHGLQQKKCPSNPTELHTLRVCCSSCCYNPEEDMSLILLLQLFVESSAQYVYHSSYKSCCCFRWCPRASALYDPESATEACCYCCCS